MIMEKPNKVTDQTYKAFLKAMQNIMGPSAKPSRNYLRRQIENPTEMVGCITCNARQTTLYVVNNQRYCKNHRPKGQ